MSIWHQDVNLESMNKRSQKTLGEYIAIEFIEIGDNFLIAKMPVDEKTKQPLGLLHGGASAALAETVGSTAANMVLNDGQVAVGLELNINHIRSIRKGHVFAKTYPFHIGATTQVWHIEIYDEHKKTVSIARLTMAVIKRP